MTLRTRLFATYSLIVVICLFVVAMATTALLKGYRDRLTMDNLDNIARPISVQIRSIATSSTTVQSLWSSLQDQAEKNNVYILLLGSKGNIIRQITPTSSEEPIQIDIAVVPKNITQPVQGKIKVSDGRIFIYAAYPLTKLTALSITSIEAIVVATPRTGSLAVIAGLIVPFTIGGVIALIISLIVAIIFARSIYKPLNKVKDAAHKIAQGDYEQRVPEEGPQEVRELAAGFNRMTEQVKRSQLQLRHFVADVSHELRSPLSSIQGFAQALLDGTASDDATKLKAAHIIDEESRRLKHQVDELLELSRMQSNRIKILKEPVDIQEVLEHCIDVYAVQAKQKRISIELKVEADVTVSGDNDRLEQVFNNLIDNAIKNSPSEGKICIVINRKDEKFSSIVVMDDGPGIPQDQLPYVFERFYQVTGTRTGVGLGLAIAKEIVIAHNGTIAASSAPGEGAHFTASLPLWQSQ